MFHKMQEMSLPGYSEILKKHYAQYDGVERPSSDLTVGFSLPRSVFQENCDTRMIKP